MWFKFEMRENPFPPVLTPECILYNLYTWSCTRDIGKRDTTIFSVDFFVFFCGFID